MVSHTKTIESCWSKRPRFFADQLLTADIMTAEQDYHRHQRWQLHRSLLGAGIVHGFEIRESADNAGCLHVEAGLAIDSWGRVLEVSPKGEHVCIDDLIVAGEALPEPGNYTLRVHYAERTWPTSQDPYCPPDDQQAGWICSGVRFSLCKGCEACDPCACPEIECCLDACSYICSRQGSAKGGVDPDPNLEHALDCPPLLCDRSDGWRWDPGAAVALACVAVCETDDRKGCGHNRVLRLADPHPCTLRRHIYRNQQLFELIRECHLVRPRLKPPDWLDEWDGVALPEIPWDEFAAQCTADDGGFPLCFTRPLRADGVHAASILLTAVTWERRTDYHEARRVPLAEIVQCETAEHDGVGFVVGVRLKPTPDWLEAEINGSRSTLFDGALMELTLRGAMLRDPCGTMLDARPPGAADGPEHARNGDDLVIAFKVGPRDAETAA